MSPLSRREILRGFLRHSVSTLVRGDVFHGIPFQPWRRHQIGADLFGVCVAAPDGPGAADYVIERLRELGIGQVRIDLSADNDTPGTAAFIRSLADAGFRILLHLVQRLPDAARMPSQPACNGWRTFVAGALDRFGNLCDCVEIGSTCNRRKWTGYSPEGFWACWLIGHEETRKRRIELAGPNVTDFEPVYNTGLLGLMADHDCLPDIHTDNLFAERAGEPEAFDHKILGRTAAGALKVNIVRKAFVLDRTGRLAGVLRFFSTHAAWSLRRINRVLPDVEEKQADYAARYLCLLAAAGTPERIYWGPLIGQREGLIDDGTAEYPEIPHVTFYGKAHGTAGSRRIRPAFGAVKTLISFLRDSTYEESPASGACLEIHAFRSWKRLVHVVWCTDGNCALPSDCYDPGLLRTVLVYSRDGAQMGGVPQLFTESPVYLVWDSASRATARGGAAILPGIRINAAAAARLAFTRGKGSFGMNQGAPSDADAYSPASLAAADGSEVMRDRRNRVWRMADPLVPGRALVVKRMRIRGLHKRIIQRWRTGRALRSWNAASELLRRGIPTPEPVAFDQPFDPLQDSHYVCEYRRPDASMRQVFEGLKRGKTRFLGIEHTDWYRSLARFVCNMHGRGVYFRDLSPGNILAFKGAGGRPSFMLIDTARARFRSHPIGLRSRLRDIRRALHPLHWDGRRRFLAEYLREAGIPYRPAMLWPLLRYDAKHWFKDRVYGRKTWLTGEPKRAASKPAGSEGVDKPGKE